MVPTVYVYVALGKIIQIIEEVLMGGCGTILPYGGAPHIKAALVMLSLENRKCYFPTRELSNI